MTTYDAQRYYWRCSEALLVLPNVTFRIQKGAFRMKNVAYSRYPPAISLFSQEGFVTHTSVYSSKRKDKTHFFKHKYK